MERRRKHNETMYVRCELSRSVEGGTAYMQSWIRQAIAIPGAVLNGLEDAETGVIEPPWTVMTASTPVFPESFLIKQGHDYDKMQRRTDI